MPRTAEKVTTYRGYDIHRETDDTVNRMTGTERSRYAVTRENHPRRLMHRATVDECKAWIDGYKRATAHGNR